MKDFFQALSFSILNGKTKDFRALMLWRRFRGRRHILDRISDPEQWGLLDQEEKVARRELISHLASMIGRLDLIDLPDHLLDFQGLAPMLEQAFMQATGLNYASYSKESQLMEATIYADEGLASQFFIEGLDLSTLRSSQNSWIRANKRIIRANQELNTQAAVKKAAKLERHQQLEASINAKLSKLTPEERKHFLTNQAKFLKFIGSGCGY